MKLFVLPLIVFASALVQAQATFSDDFNSGTLDTTKWTVATYNSPDSSHGVNAGTYSVCNFDLTQGMLRIGVAQQTNPAGGVFSQGGAIISKALFGYGTYDFDMRMSTTSTTPLGTGGTLTGAVSSAFIYLTNSESEIDLEFRGDLNDIWISTWHNPTPANPPNPSTDKVSTEVVDNHLADQFRHYTMVWSATSVDVYIDGTLVTHHTTHVPSAPAHIILQHRGTNSTSWGGVASVGVNRYAYFKHVAFTP